MSGPYLDDLIADMQTKRKYSYVIRLMSHNYWYFFDVNTMIDPHPVMWTPTMTNAFKFPDEQSVEEFKKDFITPRSVEILRIERNR